MADLSSESSSEATDFIIQGLTSKGKPFRPSDWADRLAGIMSGFRPPGSGPATHLGYSPWVQPVLIEGQRGVSVDAALAAHEAMAYAFLVNFARDNELQVRVLGKP
jgi:hypothetical protein